MTTGCQGCAAASAQAKAQGFKDWRTAYACSDHSWVDTMGEALGAGVTEADVLRAGQEMGVSALVDDEPEQPDLFLESGSEK